MQSQSSHTGTKRLFNGPREDSIDETSSSPVMSSDWRDYSCLSTVIKDSCNAYRKAFTDLKKAQQSLEKFKTKFDPEQQLVPKSLMPSVKLSIPEVDGAENTRRLFQDMSRDYAVKAGHMVLKARERAVNEAQDRLGSDATSFFHSRLNDLFSVVPELQDSSEFLNSVKGALAEFNRWLLNFRAQQAINAQKAKERFQRDQQRVDEAMEIDSRTSTRELIGHVVQSEVNKQLNARLQSSQSTKTKKKKDSNTGQRQPSAQNRGRSGGSSRRGRGNRGLSTPSASTTSRNNTTRPPRSRQQGNDSSRQQSKGKSRQGNSKRGGRQGHGHGRARAQF